MSPSLLRELTGSILETRISARAVCKLDSGQRQTRRWQQTGASGTWRVSIDAMFA